MTNIETVKIVVPSWDSEESEIPSFVPSFSVALVGITENINGSTHIKKNVFPANDDDYDVRCDSQGNLSGECPLLNVTKVYIWGYGFSLNGEYFDCEEEYNNATEVKITDDTEIMLYGANSE